MSLILAVKVQTGHRGRTALLRDSKQAAWQRQTNRVIYTAAHTYNVRHK